MKRQVLCPECSKKTRDLFPTDTPYPGEFVKFVVGNALAFMNCDSCNGDIKPGAACVAVSIWADHGGIPYFAWEHNFITLLDENDPWFAWG